MEEPVTILASIFTDCNVTAGPVGGVGLGSGFGTVAGATVTVNVSCFVVVPTVTLTLTERVLAPFVFTVNVTESPALGDSGFTLTSILSNT